MTSSWFFLSKLNKYLFTPRHDKWLSLRGLSRKSPRLNTYFWAIVIPSFIQIERQNKVELIDALSQACLSLYRYSQNSEMLNGISRTYFIPSFMHNRKKINKRRAKRS